MKRKISVEDYYELLKEAYLHTKESGRFKQLCDTQDRHIIHTWFVPHFLLMNELAFELGEIGND
jgi:hypothetical protein